MGGGSSLYRFSDPGIANSDGCDLRSRDHRDFIQIQVVPLVCCLGSPRLFCVLAWWLTLKPSNTADWQRNAAQTAWAELDGDRVTIHNLRNCDYRTESDYTNCWSDRTLDLSQIRGADFFLTNWGIRFASHRLSVFNLEITSTSHFRLRRATKQVRRIRQFLDVFVNTS